MPQPDTALDLDQLFDAIEASVRGAFPHFLVVQAYPENRRDIPTPACIIQLLELEPAENPGTEQLAAVAILEAQVVIGFRQPNAKRMVARMAAALAHHVQGQRWGMPIEPATVTAIAPSDFDPELDQFEVWAVEWQQTVHIGKSVWDDDGTVPSQVLTAWAPDVGPAHEADYQEVSAT